MSNRIKFLIDSHFPQTESPAADDDTKKEVVPNSSSSTTPRTSRPMGLLFSSMCVGLLLGWYIKRR